MKPIAVLAFSGGLDTSFCVKYLSEDKGYSVHTVTVNTGGFNNDELEAIKHRAIGLGAANHISLDLTDTFYSECVRYLLFGNILKNGTYPLSVSAERAFQAKAVAEYAASVNAKAIAHGSTGAGNDQIRFDMVFRALNPSAQIIAPIRELRLSRQEEMDYLKKHGVEMDYKKAEYSINKGLWGTSVGGRETLTSHLPLPEAAFPHQLTKTEPTKIEIGFEHGEPVSLNGQHDSATALIRKLDELANQYAIGRDIHIGDTIIGIKGRVAFEAAAPIILIKAHQTLEKHTLTKWQLLHKDPLANWYGHLMHEGHYLEPFMRDTEAFLASSQHAVTGKVFIELHPYRFQILGIESPNDLMANAFGQYGEMNLAWSGTDAEGFGRIFGLQTSIYRNVHKLSDNG